MNQEPVIQKDSINFEADLERERQSGIEKVKRNKEKKERKGERGRQTGKGERKTGRERVRVASAKSKDLGSRPPQQPGYHLL